MAEVHAPSHPEPLYRRHVRWWQVLVLCAGAATVTWMVSAVFDTRGPDRVIGPYHLPLAIETCIGVLAIVGSLFTATALARHRRPASRGLTFGTTATVVFVAVFATGWWRTATALGQGANIGGGLFVLVGPVLIVALLLAAVPVQRVTRRPQR